MIWRRGILIGRKGSNVEVTVAYLPKTQDFLQAQLDGNLKQNIIREWQHGKDLGPRCRFECRLWEILDTTVSRWCTTPQKLPRRALGMVAEGRGPHSPGHLVFWQVWLYNSHRYYPWPPHRTDLVIGLSAFSQWNVDRFSSKLDQMKALLTIYTPIFKVERNFLKPSCNLKSASCKMALPRMCEPSSGTQIRYYSDFSNSGSFGPPYMSWRFLQVHF